MEVESIFQGKTYLIPEEEMKRLSEYIENEWKPAMNRGLSTDAGIKRIPTNVKALSFTLFLQEWYEREFKKYLVVFSIFMFLLPQVGLAEEDCTKITRNFNYDGEAAYHACRAANTLEKLAERMKP